MNFDNLTEVFTDLCAYLITPYKYSDLLILTKSLADTNYFILHIFLGLKVMKKY